MTPIEEFLSSAGLSHCGYKMDEFYEGYDRYEVTVPRHQVAKAKEFVLESTISKRWPLFSVTIRQMTPNLVAADLGQLVRIYSEYECDDEKSPIGIVSSKRESEGGFVYGCRYIQISLGDSFNSDLYPFHLTSEDYGGYHSGFLKIVPNEELPAIIAKMIEDGHMKAINKANAMRDSADHNAGSFVDYLSFTSTTTIVALSFSESKRHHFVNIG